MHGHGFDYRGAEVKRATKAMQGLPLPDIMALDKNIQRAVADSHNQARVQAVSAIKEGRLPNQQLKWLLFVGPYFAEMELGPFSDAEMQTRRHKANCSGDVVELLIARAEKQAPPVQVPLYLLGMVEGATKLEAYITETSSLLD
jgi:hypothetical protein